jgi:filamentous hemagglutinin family protein
MFKFKLRPLAAALHSRHWTLALAGAVVPGMALAAPSGGVVVGGQASIGGSGGNVVVNQTSNAAIINWQQFSVGSSEYVLFNQPSASAAVLNRVVGGNASEILGNISANGRVFIINPNGVMFGQGSKVDVGGLVASTLNVSDSDFMKGRYVMTGSPSGTAAVSNAGRITAADGGFVVLAGSQVSNSGLIQARLGTVALASGSAVTLGLDSQGLVDFSVDAAALSAAAGVENLGSIVADGGSVILSAQTARGLIGNAVNNRGSVQARTIGEHEGEIYLLAEGGDIVHDGVIDASGASGTDAGTVRIEGDGDILLSGNSRIVATGDSGGDVRAIASGTLTYAKGAGLDVSRKTRGGDGGFAELSGFEHLLVRDLVTLGEYGHLLLDPENITIGPNLPNTQDPQEPATMSQALLESQIRNAGRGSIITLAAGNSITFAALANDALDGTSQIAGYGGGLDIRITGSGGSGSFIKFNDVTDTIKVNGDLSVHGSEYGGTVVTLGKVVSGGDISIDTRGAISTGDLTATNGGIYIESLAGGVTTGKLISGATLDVDAEGDIKLGDIEVDNGSVFIDSSDGGVETGKIDVAILSSSTQYDVEGGSSYIYEGIQIDAFDGIKTGDISFTMTADEARASPTYLNAFVYLNANAYPVAQDTTPSDLVTGNINVTVGRASGVTTDVVSSAKVFLTNGVAAEGDGIPSADTSGGNIKTGSITIKSNGTQTSPETCEETSAGTNCYSYPAAVSQLIVAADGKIDVQGNKVTLESASADGSDNSYATFISYFDSIALGDIRMAGNTTALSAIAAPLLTVPTNPGGLAETQNPPTATATSQPQADLTVGHLEGVEDLDLYASRNLTVNAGTRAVLLGATPRLEAGNQITLKGSDVQLAGSIGAKRLVIEATGEVSTAVERSAYIDVGGIAVTARRINLLDAALYVGNESMDLGKDTGLYSKVPQDLKPRTAGPNAAFVASESVELGTVSIFGGYLFVRSPYVSAVSVSSEGSIFYNYRPYNNTDNFEVPANGGLLPGSQVTYALGGTGYKGDITVVEAQDSFLLSTEKDLSDTNYLFLTEGRVNGKDLLGGYTSGQVLVLEGSSGPQEPPPEQQQEQAVVAQTAVSQLEFVETEGVGEVEVADGSEVEEVTDSPDETLECR